MVRDLTDEQSNNWPIFNATSWAAPVWPFFLSGGHRTRSDVMRQRAELRYRQFRSGRLEKQPTDPAAAGRNQRDLGNGTLASDLSSQDRTPVLAFAYQEEAL